MAPVAFSDVLWLNKNLDARYRDVEGMGAGHLVNEALNLLNTITITGATASVADTTSFLRDFDTFLVVWENVINNTNNRQPLFSVNVGGVQTTGYIGVLTQNNGGTITGSAVVGSIPMGPLSPNSQPGASGYLYIFNPASTANKKMIVLQSAGNTTTPAAQSATYIGYFNTNANAVTGFQVAMSGGNIASGIIRTYGIRNT